jgi:hypothetical protein
MIFPFKNGNFTIYRWFIDDFPIQSFHFSWRISHVKNMARCWISVHGVAHKLGGVAGSALDASGKSPRLWLGNLQKKMTNQSESTAN